MEFIHGNPFVPIHHATSSKVIKLQCIFRENEYCYAYADDISAWEADAATTSNYCTKPNFQECPRFTAYIQYLRAKKNE